MRASAIFFACLVSAPAAAADPAARANAAQGMVMECVQRELSTREQAIEWQSQLVSMQAKATSADTKAKDAEGEVKALQAQVKALKLKVLKGASPPDEAGEK